MVLIKKKLPKSSDSFSCSSSKEENIGKSLDKRAKFLVERKSAIIRSIFRRFNIDIKIFLLFFDFSKNNDDLLLSLKHVAYFKLKSIELVMMYFNRDLVDTFLIRS